MGETMIDRDALIKMMSGNEPLDYQTYLKTSKLLACQKPFDELVNPDELQFQIVHQVEELWMKLIIFTLLEIYDLMEERKSFKILTLFRRVHITQQLMIDQFSLLETMSPYDYQKIRLQLGNGSGQESPCFNALLTLPDPLWKRFENSYFTSQKLTIEQVYNSEYSHDETYMVAEAFAEFDELFQFFRFHHVRLIQRSIGLEAESLKGRPVKNLKKAYEMTLFPPLWKVRSQMTDQWGGTYGKVRDPINT